LSSAVPAASERLASEAPGGRPLISVIVKCLNEARNLARCLDSILAATSSHAAEIIVADAGSTDRSVEIARNFPVRVVQFKALADRNCGATAQLGWQFATGDYILLVDGDMELLPDFLPAALAALRDESSLGGVGGKLIEMSDAMEFQERLRRSPPHVARDVPCVTGCGLYRAEAIRAAGYFMDRNLHCFEELDLGGRLRSAGWRLRLLDVDCIRHYGHREVAFRLLSNRWRSRTLDGYGEFLRGALGSGRWRDALRTCRFALFTIGWWSVLAVLALAMLWSPAFAWPLLAIAALPMAALLLRKRSLDRAAYALAMWQVAGASLIRGLAASRIDPRTPLRAVILQEPGHDRTTEPRRSA
jgi:glycosyltransferase involved in cell wall biosynthesis